MRGRGEFFLEGLLSLDRCERADRRGVFRQSVASIALAAPGQSPLEGCDEHAVARSVQVAIADGLLDDLGWLAAPAMGVALFEIAGALPLGAERRELGRMVLEELYEGDAATFVAVATRMATGGSARALSGAGMRARVALSLSLPASADVSPDALALGLVSRRELATAWLGPHSIGSLPQRRMAARLLEHAAREAAERARRGDDEPAMLFYGAIRRDGEHGRPSPETIEGAWRTLIADRETLVWRHVAAARGLLSLAVPELGLEIKNALSPRFSPTEWRRAATSLVASIAVDPARALPAAIELSRGPILERDPGVATAMLWSLPLAADAEPEAAATLLDVLSRAAPLFIAEDLVEARAELGSIGAVAAPRCAEALAAAFEQGPGDDEVVTLSKRLRLHLMEDRPRASAGDGARVDIALRAALEHAIDGFAGVGSREAHARALVAVDHAREAVSLLGSLSRGEAPRNGRARGAAVVLVRELDALLLESGALRNLLQLKRGPGDPGGFAMPLDDVDDALAESLLAEESEPFAGDASAPGVMGHQRRLRALLHLIDGESAELDDDLGRRERVQRRWASTSSMLLTRLATDRATPLRRAVAATVARALDALVRDGAVEPADALLYAAFRTSGPEDLSVLAEASMNPEVWRLVRAYADFIDAELGRPFDAEPTPRIPSLEGLIAALPNAGTQRLEALRSALARLLRALSGVQGAPALRPLADPEASPLGALAEALTRLGQLTASALRRCGGEDEPIAVLPANAYPLAPALGRALEAGADVAAALQPVLTTTLERAFASIPRALAGLVARILPRIARLPVDVPGRSALTQSGHDGGRPPMPSGPAGRVTEAPLPAWMPARRTLGGFYIHRQIGGGAAGTVFIVTRSEERHDPGAERFALKVPDYDATAARSLSEADFLKLFREEAGALLALPEQENLARFVTFDAGARPKPILVMELVEGSRCDKLIASRLLTVQGAFALLDGVLAGLGAMHAVGVGHLDIKPSNVILRDERQAVLVDFGLAGRHLRPGCGTSSYGAPEVWGIAPPGVEPTPMTADLYSFGCIAYEVLTGQTLFDAPNEVALISAHLTHDGSPAGVKKLAERPMTAGLAAMLRKCLRKDPRQRGTAAEIRKGMKAVASSIGAKSWPVPL